MIEMVKAGQFREDLYYRLNVYPIMVPPLRDRKDDIPALVEHFITRLSAEEGRKVRGIAPNALPMLQAYGCRATCANLKHHLPRHCVVRERCSRNPGFSPDRLACRRLRDHRAACPAASQETIGTHGPRHDRWKPACQRSAGNQVSDGMALGIPAVTDGGHIRKLEEVEADMIRLGP